MTLIGPHSAGENKTAPKYPSGGWPVDTPAGRFHAEWDDQAPVTREGQLIFFFQFLHTGGRWVEFLRNCPLHYTGNRSSGARNVMGTALLSILCGHWRYAHINAVRGDGINPGLLGMKGTVSEDAVRLGIGRIDEESSLDWISSQILGSIASALSLPFARGCESCSVKVLCPCPALPSGGGRAKRPRRGVRRTVAKGEIHRDREKFTGTKFTGTKIHRDKIHRDRLSIENRRSITLSAFIRFAPPSQLHVD